MSQDWMDVVSNQIQIQVAEGNPATKLVLKDQNGTHEYFGPVFSSKPQTDPYGTPSWINQIFASENPVAQKAYDEAFAAAKKGLGTDQPWHTLDSSVCGLAATLHFVGAKDPVPVDVTRMVVDADHPIGDRPKVIAVAAWTSQDLMTSFEVADYDATAILVTRAKGKGSLPDPKPLASRRKA